ncbi:MAG: hypothetical protein P9L98_00110 [Candidatus Kaelpia imicola]|nr:hypothetical protein [Candidatus Kaelpia imicola]
MISKGFLKDKNLKIVYLHPHGLGDLILSMPSLEYIMGRDSNFGLIVKDAIYDSGFFKSYPYKERIFSGCSCIWDRLQIVKSFKNIDKMVEDIKIIGIDVFYLKFNKNIDRRLQINKGLSKYIGMDIPFDDRVHGKIYVEDKDIRWAQSNISSGVFFHSYSESGFKSILPKKLKKMTGLKDTPLFIPTIGDNINLNFAAQKISKVNIVIDSVYMHSSAAMAKDIDLLFVSFKVKKFFQTLKPKNININKIIYGNLFDALNSFLFYRFKKLK